MAGVGFVSGIANGFDFGRILFHFGDGGCLVTETNLQPTFLLLQLVTFQGHAQQFAFADAFLFSQCADLVDEFLVRVDRDYCHVVILRE